MVGGRSKTQNHAAAPSPAPPATATATTGGPAATTSSIDKELVATADSPARGTYAAHLPDDAGTLYIAVRDGKGTAYLCDGNRVEAWFKGTAKDGEPDLLGVKAGKLTGTFSRQSADGTVTVQGRTIDFSVPMPLGWTDLSRAAHSGGHGRDAGRSAASSWAAGVTRAPHNLEDHGYRP